MYYYTLCANKINKKFTDYYVNIKDEVWIQYYSNGLYTIIIQPILHELYNDAILLQKNIILQL